MEWNHNLLRPARLQTHADAVYAKGELLENCFGFVDGTVRPIAHPDDNHSCLHWTQKGTCPEISVSGTT